MLAIDVAPSDELTVPGNQVDEGARRLRHAARSDRVAEYPRVPGAHARRDVGRHAVLGDAPSQASLTNRNRTMTRDARGSRACPHSNTRARSAGLVVSFHAGRTIETRPTRVKGLADPGGRP